VILQDNVATILGCDEMKCIAKCIGGRILKVGP